MKWPKKKCRDVEIPLYGSSVFAFRNRKAFQEAADYLGVDADHLTLAGLSLHLEQQETGHTIYLLGVFDKQLGTLVHECTHIAHFICARAGFSGDVGNGEPYAYLVGYIFEQLEDFVKGKYRGKT